MLNTCERILVRMPCKLRCKDREVEQEVDAKGDDIEVFYNQRRRHSTLGQISPAAFERQAGAEGMDAAIPVDAKNAPTGIWKTAQNAVSHSAHSHHSCI